MPHAIIHTNNQITNLSSPSLYFSIKGNFFISPQESSCESFIIRSYQKNSKVIVKLDKTTYPLITDDVKKMVLEFARSLAYKLKGRIIHHNLAQNNKNCEILKRYLLKVNRINQKSINSFLNSKRIQVEIGIGKGEFLAKLAKTNPDISFVGFEIANDALAKAALRFSRENLTNIRLINYDARYALDLFEPNSIETVYVNFPEPWFKFKKLKHALLNLDTIKKIERVLKKGGTFKLLTDNLAYAVSVATACETHPNLKNQQRRCIEQFKSSIDTYYERRWKRRKRLIYSVTYQKKEESNKTETHSITFPFKIKKGYLLECGIIFKILDIFENSVGQKIAEITLGKSINPQHAFFGLDSEGNLFLLPQSVFVMDQEAKLALEFASKN